LDKSSINDLLGGYNKTTVRTGLALFINLVKNGETGKKKMIK